MARRKFQVGDKIKVVKDMAIGGDHHGIKLGRKGKIKRFDSEYPEYPYAVKFKGVSEVHFNAKELEKVED